MASHFFTSRFGGVSAGPYQENNLALHVGDNTEDVRENRRRLKSIIGDVAFMNQSHGNDIALLNDVPAVEPSADALITQSRGLFLGVLTADCIPLLLWDQNFKCVAAVHVGRKGLLNDVAIRSVEKMRDLGSENIFGVLGPSICKDCYEVGQDVFDEVVSVFPQAGSRARTGKSSLDLATALQDRLTAWGVNTARALSCTVEDRSLFSYRRDGVTGRFAGVVSL